MRIAILSVVLFLSGISALIFETLWLRLSGLAFGNSVWSAALILSSFMAGLALGSALASRYQIRRVRPLRAYAVLELIIGLLGCTIVFAIPALGEWMRPLFQALWNHDAVMNAVRLLFSFLILLIPSTAMGLSLPVVLEDGAARRLSFGRAMGLLYGCNTLGAVTGALLGEAWLVKAFGLWGTGLAAGILNGTAALIAWMLATAVPGEDIGAQKQEQIAVRKLPWRFLSLSFGTGFVLLFLEIVWFRFLRLFVASSPIAFAVMLAVVLAGIGLGAVASSFMRLRGRLSILLAVAAVMTLLCYLFFPIKFVGGSDFYLDTWQEISVLSLALMFPVSFLSGILFPAIAARIQEDFPSRMNSAGLATLFNTLGAALGPLLASFVDLPTIGFQWSLTFGALIYVTLSWLARGETASGGRVQIFAPLVGTAASLFLIIFSLGQDEKHFAHARKPFEADGSHLVKKIEGVADTLQLLRRDLYYESYYFRLVTNAFTMSDTRWQNLRYMRLFAYLPLTLRPESEDALLICFGCGVTADALVHDLHLKHIDFVDISREVFDLAPYYSYPGYSLPLRDMRVTTFVQDGRFFLQAGERQYDVITGEPPPPKVAGTVNLYTQEFFSLMNRRLKEGGIATFWLPINQLKIDEAKAILRAFHKAFPNASVWANSDYEWIMMGIKGPGRRLSEEEFRRFWGQRETREDLERIGMERPEQLAAMFLMDGPEIDRLTAGIKPLTDFYPKRLSDDPAEPEKTHRLEWEFIEAQSAARRFRLSPLMERLWPAGTGGELEPLFKVRETRYLSDIKNGNKFAELDNYLRQTTLRSPVLEVLNSDGLRVSIAQRVALATPQLRAEMRPDLIAGALSQRDFKRAIELLETEKAEGSLQRDDFFLLTYLYCLNGKVDEAEKLAADFGLLEKDWFVDWLWGKLQAEFGFRPPPAR